MRVRIKAVLSHNQSDVSLAQSYSGTVFIWGFQASTGTISRRPVDSKYKSLEAAFTSTCERPVTSRLINLEDDDILNMGGTFGAPNWLRLRFDHQNSSDLTIIVGGKSIYVHKAVLKLGSAHFRAMLDDENGWKESKSPTIQIQDFTYPVYRAYLYYLYSDEICMAPEATMDEAISLMDLASSYLEEDLKLKAFVQFLLSIFKSQTLLISDRIDFFASRWLEIENAATIYTLSIDHMLDELTNVTLEFILHNLTAVVTSEAFKKIESSHAKCLFIKAANRRLFNM